VGLCWHASGGDRRQCRCGAPPHATPQQPLYLHESATAAGLALQRRQGERKAARASARRRPHRSARRPGRGQVPQLKVADHAVQEASRELEEGKRARARVHRDHRSLLTVVFLYARTLCVSLVQQEGVCTGACRRKRAALRRAGPRTRPPPPSTRPSPRFERSQRSLIELDAQLRPCCRAAARAHAACSRQRPQEPSPSTRESCPLHRPPGPPPSLGSVPCCLPGTMRVQLLTQPSPTEARAPPLLSLKPGACEPRGCRAEGCEVLKGHAKRRATTRRARPWRGTACGAPLHPWQGKVLGLVVGASGRDGESLPSAGTKRFGVKLAPSKFHIKVC
jgi:hypothetical protein